MHASERLTVPTCIGCGAMTKLGSCDAGCSEQKLELVRAAAYEQLLAATSSTLVRADAFAQIASQIRSCSSPPGEFDRAYRSVQTAALNALHAHPEIDDGIDLEAPSEPAVTWWCPDCGGIDAPQPCLGICLWRPVEWVSRESYEQQRGYARDQHRREVSLRKLLRRAASVTPRPGHWQRGWEALAREARVLDEAANYPGSQ